MSEPDNWPSSPGLPGRSSIPGLVMSIAALLAVWVYQIRPGVLGRPVKPGDDGYKAPPKYSINNHAINEMASRPLAPYKGPSPLTSRPMPHFSSLLGFALVSFGMVLTPGPNMIYLISRSISQGRMAGLILLGGVALLLVFYMVGAAFGLPALFVAVLSGNDALRFGR